MARRPASLETGLTLIELVVAVVLLGITMTPVMVSLVESSIDTIVAERQVRSHFLAIDKVEEIIADRHASSRGFDYLESANYPSDAVDNFTRTVTFSEVSPTDLSTPQVDSGYLLVVVNVSYTAPAGDYEIACVICELSS